MAKGTINGMIGVYTRIPHWENVCRHEDGTYVGTFDIFDRKSGEFKYYDVYVYDEGIGGCSACIRFGNDGPDYYSPGNLGGFLTRSQIMDEYKYAADLILTAGKVTYKLN